MVFSSLTFLTLFLPLTIILYFSGRSLRWRNGVLLAASLLFYGWGEPVWILAMVASVAVNYFCAMAICRAKSEGARRGFLALGVIGSLAALVYFKYGAFVLGTFSGLFGAAIELPVLELPVGISFYTFQVLTYTVDVYRKKSPLQRSFWKLLLYISCFPQLIAGPIVQYSDVAAMLEKRTTTLDDFTAGMKRLVVGLGKKVLLANTCGLILKQLPPVAAGPISVACAWYGAALYALQIYFDFSGYSDMAIGLGRVFGFAYKENFRYPYLSGSVTEFWRRWHISLGAFFRDYVYIPLGGSRRGRGRTVRNLLTVWMLTGLWHGASWNFVLWGLYYGVILILERFVTGKLLKKLPGLITVPCTLLLVLAGWVIFYYTDLGNVGAHIGAMVGIGAGGWMDPMTLAVMKKYTVLPLGAAAAALPVVPWLRSRIPRKLEGAAEFLTTVLLTGVLLLSMMFLVGQSYNPFIYFRF